MKPSLGKQFSKSSLKGRNSLVRCVGNLVGSAATLLLMLGAITGTTAGPLDPNNGPKTDPCVPPPPGLASWWPAENAAIDIVSGNIGSPSGGVSYTNGLVGQAFQFDGSGFIAVPASPSLNIGTGSGITIECWAKLNWSGAGMPLVEWDAPNIEGVSLWVDAGPRLLVNLRDTLGTSHVIASPDGSVSVNGFQHLALTYDRTSGLCVLYTNGIPVASQNMGSFTPQTTYPFNLGKRTAAITGQGTSFQGVLDEVSLYSRALTAEEIQAVYNAGAGGKCLTPTPPFIYSQPASQTVIVGDTAVFAVFAGGSPPLSYQWLFNGTNIDGATNTTLSSSNAQLADAGDYAVLVSSPQGSVVSSNAVLTVNPTRLCVPPPTGLASWWPAENAAVDIVSGNIGSPSGGVSYTNGLVGQAFQFDGSGFIAVPASPSLNIGTGSGITIECWAKLNWSGAGMPLVEWDAPNIEGVSLWVDAGPRLLVNLRDTLGTSHVIASPDGSVSVNGFQHLALTYDRTSGLCVLYTNGIPVESQNLGSFTPETTYPFNLGKRTAAITGQGTTFEGVLDEISLYSRALSAGEIQAIFHAGAQGKCATGFPPAIFSQPANQTVTVGGGATFAVVAGGSSPRSYQWLFNGTNLDGATAATLNLVNVQTTNEGNYSVVVANSLGSATSSNAMLTVNLPPTLIHLLSADAAAGGAVALSLEVVANGIENAVGFSLQFDPSLLSFLDASLAPALLPDASIVVNANDASAGRVGLAVAQPAGTTFPAGTQQLAIVRFRVAPVLNPVSIPLTFGDQPIARQVSDCLAHELSAVFTGGQVSVTRVEFEGDVAPRPSGDHAITIIDWVQMGRFIAGLDDVQATEFQRADCAPRETLGNGIISVSDWVQVGRYAVGLDPVTAAGGPRVPQALVAGKLQPRASAKSDSARRVWFEGANAQPGATLVRPVRLAAQGNENALAFSVIFDPVALSFLSAAKGSGVTAGTLNVNTNQLAGGKLGFALALPTTNSVGVGTQDVVLLSFIVASNAVGASVVAFADQPVLREVADTAANTLPSSFAPGAFTFTLAGPPVAFAVSSGNLLVYWPSSAQGFTLVSASNLTSASWTQVNGAVLDIGGQKLMTVPLNLPQQFFRLRKP